jgi:hypothetical protein
VDNINTDTNTLVKPETKNNSTEVGMDIDKQEVRKISFLENVVLF